MVFKADEVDRSPTHYFKNRALIFSRGKAKRHHRLDLLNYMDFYMCDQVVDLVSSWDQIWEVGKDAILEDF